MKLTSFEIKNFRGLSKIEAGIDKPVSVIVGPNAIGKTSVLEATRLTKGLLAPRMAGEPEQTLTDMGAFFNTRLSYESIAGDVSKALEVNLTFELNAKETEAIGSHAPQLIMLHMRNMLGIPPGQSDVNLAQFMSSDKGAQAAKTATEFVHTHAARLGQSPKIKLLLKIDCRGSSVRGSDIFSQECMSVLDSSLPPSKTYMSYFPADRALPSGESSVQIGSADTNSKLQAHLVHPASKYTRLKNIIVNEILLGEESASALRREFDAIFNGLLIGKRLKGLTLNKHGGVSVQIEEVQSGKTYDLDRMSSGEKGLILQFLLMRHSIEKDGIVLIDEPELHLNPAVTKRLIPFFIEQVVRARGIQAIICSHSAEVLASAFERDDCQLFHLRSGEDLSPVFRKDKGEVFEALKRLGTATSDVLFSKGNMFVEGIHDADLLEIGFPNRVSAFKITQLRGRGEVEKEIKNLKEEEREGHLTDANYFLFDRDRSPSAIESSSLVRVRQWQRYCFENYLLDANSIFDALQDGNASSMPSRGALKSALKETAIAQIRSVVARLVYKKYEPENCGLRSNEVDHLASYDNIASALSLRIERLKAALAVQSKEMWIAKFKEECQSVETEISDKWDDNWQTECDGKKVLLAMHRDFGAKGSLLEFKKRIIRIMAANSTESWRSADSLLAELIGTHNQ